MTTEETLNDLKLWMQRHLENTHARNNSTGYGQKKGDGFAVVEIPDWEMRQKLAAVEEALKNVNIPEPCPDCQDRAQAEGEAWDGMTNAAEMSGMM